MALDLRTIGPDDIAAWHHAVNTGFTMPPTLTDEQVAKRREHLDYSRARGVFDGGGRCVAALRSVDQRLTHVGGASLASNAITNVAVLPTHRRRGLMTRMMAEDLAAAKERGDAVATLIAAEYRIYGRFGFGPATTTTAFRVDVLRSGRDPHRAGPEDGGEVSFADAAEVRKLGPELHERFRAGQPGAVDRSELWWRLATGEVVLGPAPWPEPFFVVYRDARGVPQGMLTYTSDSRWEGWRSEQTATVRDLFATTPAAERALWHFLLSVDWIMRIEAEERAPDDLLPDLLPDRRAAAVRSQNDFLWMRPLDVPLVLGSRSYAAEGELVLDVRDPMGLAGGRFALRASPEGADCSPTTRAADLSMEIGTLGSLCLGDVTAARLAALGRVDEERAGAVARADALLRTGRRPWCPDIF
ncbi:GNAT family N-acetyltransferase [Streptomyces sodiiphilus]|uniref:GNAT family N-acetyltransferase n=1 Tax=Streptomyces sodiiphilus TaxID=226217 RepID=A0ABN2PU86_9ACTN